MRVYMHAFQGQAVQQCVNDLAYVCVTCARACVTVTDESRLSAQVYFYLRTTADYSSNVWMCIHVCVWW